MKQEYTLLLIVGLLILAYVLDAVVNPLNINLPTPYHYFIPETMMSYSFTTTSIVIKAVAIFITPLWLLSFIGWNKKVKGSILLVLGGLMQLYSLQAVATNSKIIPLEWSLTLALAGAVMLIPAVLYFVTGFLDLGNKQTVDLFKEDDELN
ncbi:hypothetical protein HYZ78_03145 [Candidatus Microgenomates bacterium]|nr:hypothetical protein [Candidatus Microgenomates bacterium]